MNECEICKDPLVACIHVNEKLIAFVAKAHASFPEKPYIAIISPWWEEGDMQARGAYFKTQEEAEAFMHNPPPFERD